MFEEILFIYILDNLYTLSALFKFNYIVNNIEFFLKKFLVEKAQLLLITEWNKQTFYSAFVSNILWELFQAPELMFHFVTDTEKGGYLIIKYNMTTITILMFFSNPINWIFPFLFWFFFTTEDFFFIKSKLFSFQ